MQEVDDAAEFALNSPDPDPATLMQDVFMRRCNNMSMKTYAMAIRDVIIAEEMRRDERDYYGEDIEVLGIFVGMRDLYKEFGTEPGKEYSHIRSRYCKAGVGSVCRYAANCRTYVYGFYVCSHDQLLNQAAKTRYIWWEGSNSLWSFGDSRVLVAAMQLLILRV